ncbi:MAG TPA: hypothetical protein VNE58_03340 [Casimicrobiaceae bacterium]|nr:hypothetical protein [Casimicrobiaceae bacterium]
MNQRIRLAMFLGALAAAASARAAIDYTDTWWTPAEGGWGVTLTQQRDTIYVTFYVYGPDGRPTWYAALLSRDGTAERFVGQLHRTTGTFFGAPWTGFTLAPAGSATFTATSSTSGTLTYTAEGSSVTKTIERITLASLSVAGVYIGGVSGRRSGCASGSGAFIDPMQFVIQHSTQTGDVRIDQISTATGQRVCRMEGKAAQLGRLLTVEGGSYACVDGWTSSVRIDNLRPTSGGFEAQWFADRGNGCTESGQLSGVTQFP